MQRKTIGELVFWGAAGTALVLYLLTVPDGMPWNGSVRLACAYFGRDGGCGATALPLSETNGLPHPIWGFYVKVFGGPVALSVSLVALAAGLIAVLVNRYFGWRFAVSAAVVWIFLPVVWNRAITGERGVCLAAMAVVAVWVANAIVLRVTWKARETRVTRRAAMALDGGGCGASALPGVSQKVKRAKINRIAGWVALGAAGLFAIISATLHDYRLGEAASAYARLVVEEAGDRVILLNGVVDEQIVRELKLRAEVEKRNYSASSDEKEDHHSSTPTQNFNFISLRNTEANRSNIVAFAKIAFPTETNLWLEAEIGPASFAEAAVKVHPERFYSMMGHSTTLEKWKERWETMKPYLKSDDPFIPSMRRMLAYEGNFLANAMSEKKRAWDLYYRIFTEIHPKNPAACVNLNVMLRQGYRVDESTRQFIESEQADYAKLMADCQKAKRLAEWISHFGPVMRDQKTCGELRARVGKWMENQEKKGDKHSLIPDLKTLEEWHPAMMKAFHEGEYDKAACIARAILSRKAWRGYVPAYMVLGETMLMKGDALAAESFLRVAAEARGGAAPPPFVFNDYAEALRRLGRLDEAERYARRAVKESDEKTGWIYRLTLVQVLEEKKGAGDRCAAEIEVLLKTVLKYASKEAREKICKEYGGCSVQKGPRK